MRSREDNAKEEDQGGVASSNLVAEEVLNRMLKELRERNDKLLKACGVL